MSDRSRRESDRFADVIEGASRTVYRQMDGWSQANPEKVDDIADNMHGVGLKPVRDGADGLLEDLSDGQGFIDSAEEAYFTGYYNEAGWPQVRIPTPDEIALPDLEYTYDVPTDDLPALLKGAVPSEISYSYDSPEIDLPSGLGELVDAIEAFHDVAGSGGVDTTLESRMRYLDENVGSLAEQDDDAREEFVGALETGINGVSQVTEALIDVLERLEGLLTGGSEWAGYLSILAVGLAVASSMTAVGPVVSLGVAATLATASAALSIASLAVDGLQIATGQAYLSNLTTVHSLGTHVVTRKTLGGGV